MKPFRAIDCGEVVHKIEPTKCFNAGIQRLHISNVIVLELKQWMRHEVLDVGKGSSKQRIQSKDFMALFKKGLTQRRSEEPRSASD
jgi:hypothetical protein